TPSATTAFYPLSLHDALPIFRVPRGADAVGPPGSARLRKDLGHGQGARSVRAGVARAAHEPAVAPAATRRTRPTASTVAMTSSGDRKSTRLNSSHVKISYAVF